MWSPSPCSSVEYRGAPVVPQPCQTEQLLYKERIVLTFERHLVVVLVIAAVLVLAAVLAVFLELPLPFFEDI